MEKLHQSRYFLVEHDPDNRLFYYVFNDETAHMSSEAYIDELKTFITLLKEYKPLRVLGHMVDFQFAITPDIQEWVTHHLFPVYQEIGFQKIAILLSKEFVAALSIEQTMEESNNSFKSAYFHDETQAMQWLLKT